MFWTIVMLSVILWGVGMVASVTFGGFIHVLLLVALGAVLIRVIQGRQVLGDAKCHQTNPNQRTEERIET